jgi:hypothetical protein
VAGRLAYLAIALVAVALYAANLADPFVGDDFDLIGSFHGKPFGYLVALLWSNESGEAWKSWGIDPALGRGYLRPLKIWLLALDARVWGMHAAGWHVTSTALFAACAAQILALLRRALPGRPALAFAGAFAAIAHPVFSEVVPFVTAREETLSLALGLAALRAFVRHRDDGASPLAFFGWLALALLAKESSLAFLPLFAAHDLAHGRLRPGAPLAPLLRTWAPVAAILAIYFGLRFVAFGNFVGGSGEPTWFFQSRALAYYPRLFGSLADPTLLSFGGAPGGPALAALLFGAPIAAVAWAWRRIPDARRRDLLFFGPLWLLGSTALYTGVYFATRHHVLPVVGLALFLTVALGALLDAGVLARERRWAVALAGAAALLLVPPTILTSLEWHQASRVVRDLRAEIERRTANLPDGSSVLAADVPQLLLPPFYFGWGLLSSLRAPFSPGNVAGRLHVYNLQNIGLTRAKVELPERYDRVLQLGGTARVPDWVRARYERRLERDLGLRVPQRGAGDETVGRRPL